jgi:hypothetical protein
MILLLLPQLRRLDCAATKTKSERTQRRAAWFHEKPRNQSGAFVMQSEPGFAEGFEMAENLPTVFGAISWH